MDAILLSNIRVTKGRIHKHTCFNVLYLIPQDQRPDQPQDQLQLPIHNIFSSYTHQLQPLILDELDGPIVVLYLLEPALWVLGVLDEGLPRDDLQQVDQQHSIFKVFLNVVDLQDPFFQVVIRPSCEGLLVL